jgi:lipopolysaccharide biosynthesis regulator YciM
LGASLILAACLGAAGEHERLGDRAYTQSDFDQALVEYRLALRQEAPNGRLRAKAAMAALHAGDLIAAAEEFRNLADEADDRTTEAADGLERVARASLDADNPLALEAALGGLQEIASGRALGVFAGQVAQALGTDARSPEALAVLPYAAASASDARLQDSLMYAYGVATVRTGGCERAIAVFESLLRRRREPAVLDDARRRLGACLLRLGERDLDRGFPERAEEWFVRAVAGGADDAYARAAYVGLGDVRLARGDYLAAMSAYQRAMLDGAARDSISRIAAERLAAIGDAGTVLRRRR